MKKDPFYRLTANIEEASDEESAEIMDTMKGLSDDDLTILLSNILMFKWRYRVADKKGITYEIAYTK